MESLIHRDYAALVAALPLIAAGAVATFAWRDRGLADSAEPDGTTGPVTAALPQDVEYALMGVLLAVMAERLEHDPAAYPLLAGAASRLVPPGVRITSGPHGWTGLTERARQAAVQVLRPTALSTLARAATGDYLGAVG